MEKPKRPPLGYLIYRYFGVSTFSYQRYWKKYCRYMQYMLNRQRPVLAKVYHN